jgi:hypothetical protein
MLSPRKIASQRALIGATPGGEPAGDSNSVFVRTRPSGDSG